jgi:phage gp29-like protein
MSDTDWANYNAANATIVRKAVVPRGATRASKDLFLDQLDDLGRDSSSLLCERNVDGSGFDFEYIAPGGGSQLDTFERSKADAAKQITIEILGQDKTTDMGANGARAAVETLQQVEDAIVAADAAGLSTVLRCQILEPWAALNLGSAALAPWPVWEVEQPENAGEIAASDKAVAEAAEALETALRGSGKALDKLAYFERAGIPMIDAPLAPAAPALVQP